MQKIVPNVWCQGTAGEAADFYSIALPGTSYDVTARYPTENLPDFQKSFAGEPLVVDVDVNGYLIRLINAGNEFKPNPAISFIFSMSPSETDGGEEAVRAQFASTWESLSNGGEVRMELGEYPFSGLYGWVEDRYGVNWQLMIGDSNQAQGPTVTPQFLFTGPEAKAKDAIELYSTLIPDSSVQLVAEKPDQPGWVQFSQFNLAAQPFSAMDGGTDHQFTFTPGLSLEIDCADQGEIDRLWESLSTVPEAEQCGWCVDSFGVSWQIVPANMGELMERPGAYQNMLQMKKIIIADL